MVVESKKRRRESCSRQNFWQKLTRVAFSTKVRKSYSMGAGFPAGFPPGYTGVLHLRVPAPRKKRLTKKE